MPAKRYIVHLTEDERTELLGLITKGITSARLLTRTRRLLKADECWKTPTNPLLIGGSRLPMLVSNYVVSISHIQND